MNEHQLTLWFKRRKQQLLRDISALDALVAAFRAIQRLLDDWDTEDALGDIRGALFLYSVISYARPFTANRSAGSSGKSTYPIKRLKRVQGFDAQLHARILNVRHRLIAHADGETFPPRLVTSGANILSETGTRSKTPPFLATLSAYSLHSISDKEVARVMLEHLRVCVGTVGVELETGLREYLERAATNPAAHDMSRDSNERIPVSLQDASDIKPIGFNEVGCFGSLSRLEQAMYRAPGCSVHDDAFVYRMLTISTMLESVDFVQGDQPVRMHLADDPAKIAMPPTL